MHYKVVCEYGITHESCRCFSRQKDLRWVECDRPEEHAEYRKYSRDDHTRWLDGKRIETIDTDDIL